MGKVQNVTDISLPVTAYDGCGKCLVGAIRLSRMTDKTHSPQKQVNHSLTGAAANGGHIIAWAIDLEVSGATNPLTRPGLGPWLRGERGDYDGIAAYDVARVGRNVRDVLNTQQLLTDQGRIIITGDHDGTWDFSDPNEENNWIMKAWGSQMELRQTQKRNRDETDRARSDGDPKQKPSYGYQFMRLSPTARIDHVAVDDVAAGVIREVARRILADATGKVTCATEAARLNREAVPAPSDRRARLYARPAKGCAWTAKTIGHILTSEAALGYLMHDGRPVTGPDGKPTRIAPPLWDRPTRDALIAKTAPKGTRDAAPRGTQMLTGGAWCGRCGQVLYVGGPRGRATYGCTGRVRGIQASAECKPAPSIRVAELDARVSAWFTATYGAGEVMKRVWDPGTGHAAQVAELTTARTRLQADRDAGLYDEPDQAAWYQARHRSLTEEIKALRALKERRPGMTEIGAGRTIGQEWQAAGSARRREMLAEFGVRVVINARKAPAAARMAAGDKPPRVTITGTEAPAARLTAEAA
ncbi:MAG: recombinase family protein [Trebonia sp.]